MAKLFLGLIVGLTIAATQTSAQQSRPNIVIVLADDLGYGDLQCYNAQSKVPTPNLDGLAESGMRFTDAHSGAAVCSPTRYGLLTGRHFLRRPNWIKGILNQCLIDERQLTVVEYLKEHGYHTACFGKWHLGQTWFDREGNPGGPSFKTDYTCPTKNGPNDLSGKKFELYDLTDDLGEKNDIADQHADVVESMKSELQQWIDSVEASRLGNDYESASAAASPARAPARGKKTHLFLLSGQSNMKNLDPDISFTPALLKAFPDDEVIVTKVAYGGRSIARWVPRGKIYKELLEQAREDVAGKDIDTVTFIWMQGEKDHQEDATTNLYEANLKALYEQLTEDLKRDDINWVIGRLSDARLGTPNWDTIREMQVDVAEGNPRAAWIDTDDLNGPGNAVHCPPEGYKQMGFRFAEKAIALLKQASATRK